MSREGSVGSSFGRIGSGRGIQAEQLVSGAFSGRLAERKVPKWLVGIERADPVDEGKGVDFWILTRDTGKIPLQIKSSRRSKILAEQKHQNVPVVIVKLGESSDLIFDHCLGVIGTERARYLKARGLDV